MGTVDGVDFLSCFFCCIRRFSNIVGSEKVRFSFIESTYLDLVQLKKREAVLLRSDFEADCPTYVIPKNRVQNRKVHP
jgi:hypothetical protein